MGSRSARFTNSQPALEAFSIQSQPKGSRRLGRWHIVSLVTMVVLVMGVLYGLALPLPFLKERAVCGFDPQQRVGAVLLQAEVSIVTPTLRDREVEAAIASQTHRQFELADEVCDEPGV
jgi:hypothetical protein